MMMMMIVIGLLSLRPAFAYAIILMTERDRGNKPLVHRQKVGLRSEKQFMLRKLLKTIKSILCNWIFTIV